MKSQPMLPELFGDDLLIFNFLFDATDPSQADVTAEGEVLAAHVTAGPTSLPLPDGDLPDAAADGPDGPGPFSANDPPGFDASASIGSGDNTESVRTGDAQGNTQSSSSESFAIGGPPNFGDSFDARGGGGGPNGGGGGSKGGGGGGKSDPVYYFSDNGGDADAGGGNGLAGFDIVIKFDGTGWTDLLMDAFKDAADYLTTVIQNDWDLDGTSEITSRRDKLVWDDLYLEVSLGEIDGSGDATGNVLAQAGPTGFWGDYIGLPAKGEITFDSADFVAESPYLAVADEIAFHEMMHTLGFGTLWGDSSLLNPYGQGHLDATTGDYTGSWGVAAYQAEFDTTVTEIPVEGDGGAGTAGGHWDELELGVITQDGAVYQGEAELMTGYITDGAFLSYTSVMSLQDLGYDVDYVDYDPSVYAYEGLDIDNFSVA